MSIVFDIASHSTTDTFSHTCTGNNRMLFVSASCESNITGITYNGLSMSVVNPDTYGKIYSYYLINPASGAHNIIVTRSNPSMALTVVAASYTGVNQNGFNENTRSDHNTPGLDGVTDVSIVSVSDSSWGICVARNEFAANTTSVYSGLTYRTDSAGGNTGDGHLYLFDSNGELLPGGETNVLKISSAPSTIEYAITSGFAPYVIPSNTIKFDAAAGLTDDYGTTPSWTHTVGDGPNRILVAACWGNGGMSSLQHVYCNGLAPDNINNPAYLDLNYGDTSCKCEIYFWLNPPVGANVITIHNGGSGYDTMGSSVSYFGVKQYEPLIRAGASGKGYPSTSATFNTATNGSWGIAVAAVSKGSPTCDLTLRDQTGSRMGIWDTNGLLSVNGGSNTTNVGGATGGGYNTAAVAFFSLDPANVTPGKIMFDALSTVSDNTTTLTVAHTCNGDNRLLVVAIAIPSSNRPITTATYDGVPLTAGPSCYGSSGWAFVYYLLNPNQGTHNIVLTRSGSNTFAWGSVNVSYNGVRQTGTTIESDAEVNHVSTQQIMTATIASMSNGAWGIAIAQSDASAGFTVNSGVYPTARGTVGSAQSNIGYFDTRAPLVSIGNNNSAQITATYGGIEYGSLLFFSIPADFPPEPSFLLNFI